MPNLTFHRQIFGEQCLSASYDAQVHDGGQLEELFVAYFLLCVRGRTIATLDDWSLNKDGENNKQNELKSKIYHTYLFLLSSHPHNKTCK